MAPLSRPAPAYAGAPERTDVIVVGAGPVGLLLAGDLRRAGVRVTVLEQLTAPATASRASTLHTRTMELLAERGLLARLGPLPPGGPGHFGGLPLDLRAAAPGHPYAGQFKCPQPRLEAALHAWATGLGARVRRGHAVTGLRQYADRVVVSGIELGSGPRRFAASYVVGCDGERSTVRQLAGFDFPGDDPSLEMLRADVAGIGVPNRRFERRPNGLATAHRWPDGTTRIMVHAHGSVPVPRTGQPSFDEVVAAWAKVTGESIGHGTPVWLDAFDDTSRQAARYVKGRVILAGDAAHTQMPVGGQALNLGLQDAAALGHRLADRVTGRTADAGLEEYERLRHRVGARTLTGIRAQSRLLLGGPEVEGLRTVMAELLDLDSAAGYLARIISGVDHEPDTTTSPTPLPHEGVAA
ncbi:FAD-dependent monooxygenase [Streptomyces hydrogenans]|uniref:FAD-dependent monooxygenase n=1 Tax=Streptomyces hydrogenans TaxID=1873719 RepID=UPI0036638F5B